MALNKYKFGDLIELNIVKNSEGAYGEQDAIGVNIDKIIMPMRGSNENKDYEKFNLVPPMHFAYNPRGSRKLGLGYNDTNKTYIITFNDNVFRIKKSAQNIILDKYLFMYLSRREWDRRAEFISWGSSTEVFDWNIFCEEEIQLPDISVQQKYVDIYNAMIANQQSYERGLEDLKLACDGYIEDLRRKIPCERIGPYIEKVDERNSNLSLGVADVKSVNMDGTFAETVANVDADRIHTYKVVKPNEFAYTNRINIGSIARRLPEDGCCLVSASYDVFEITNKEKLLPEYLTLWIRRSEFFRSTGFYAVGSVKDSFSVDMMKLLEIPIPDMTIQQAIVSLYQVYLTRKKLNEQLKAQIKNICPTLIRGSLEEGKAGREF